MRVLHTAGWKGAFYREIRRFISRPVYFFLTILLPVGFLLFFTTFFDEGLPEKLPIGIIDHDGSMLSRKIIRQLDATQQSKVAGTYQHFADARAAMQEGKVYAFVEFPVGFQDDVMSGLQPTVHYYYNQAYFVAGSLLLRDMGILLNTMSGGVNLQTREARGQSEAEGMAQVQPLVPEVHAIGNPYLNYSVYLSNILLPAMLQLVVLLTIVYVIGVELKKGSSLRWLRTSKQSFFQALMGKLLPYTVIFTIMGVLYEVVLFKFMHFPLYGSFGWMALAVFLLVLATECMAILMIGLFPVLRDGLSFAGLYGILAFSYSGLVYPIEGMPLSLQTISYLFPLRFFFKIYQQVALNEISAWYSLPDYLLLLAFLVMPLLIWKRLHKALVKLNYPKK